MVDATRARKLNVESSCELGLSFAWRPPFSYAVFKPESALGPANEDSHLAPQLCATAKGRQGQSPDQGLLQQSASSVQKA